MRIFISKMQILAIQVINYQIRSSTLTCDPYLDTGEKNLGSVSI